MDNFLVSQSNVKRERGSFAQFGRSLSLGGVGCSRNTGVRGARQAQLLDWSPLSQLDAGLVSLLHGQPLSA